jgi:hypothetical protein
MSEFGLRNSCAEHNKCLFCDPSCFYLGIPSCDTIVLPIPLDDTEEDAE